MNANFLFLSFLQFWELNPVPYVMYARQILHHWGAVLSAGVYLNFRWDVFSGMLEPAHIISISIPWNHIKVYYYERIYPLKTYKFHKPEVPTLPDK